MLASCISLEGSLFTFQATWLNCNLASLVSLRKAMIFIDHVVFSCSKGGYDMLSSLLYPKQN